MLATTLLYFKVISLWQVLIFFCAAIPLLAFWYKKYWDGQYDYWKKRGAPHLPGTYPYGSSEKYFQDKTFIEKVLEEFYRQFRDEPYFGMYNGTKKLLVLCDPEVVKLVMAKEFAHFRNRLETNLLKDDILSHHLFMLNGDKWRALRIKMSPTFTSGKLKTMFPLFVKCSEALDNLLLSLIDTDIDVRDITRRFSTDVICSCAFGLEMDCINNENDPFGRVAKNSDLKMGLYVKMLFALKKYFPFLPFTPKFRITSKAIEDFMMSTIKATVEHREKTGQKRNDFIDLLIELKDKEILTDHLTEEEKKDKNIEPIVMNLEVMAAQCYVFYAAGLETSSAVKTFCLYELAVHPEIQERLYREITNTLSKHGGFTYQAVNEMEYLDMVVSETMRKYPTLFTLTRICTSNYTFPSGLKIDKGVTVIIPVRALHHDPEYYPNPNEFQPERFLPNEKEARHPYCYLPFGEGPRICIGMRFGLLQTKMGLVTFLRKYKVEPSEKTEVPLTLAGSSGPTTQPKTPIILRLTKRS